MPDALVKLIVSGEEVDSCGHRRVVGCDGVGEGVKGGFNTVHLTLYNGIHGVSTLGRSFTFICWVGAFDVQNRTQPLFICPSDPTIYVRFRCKIDGGKDV